MSKTWHKHIKGYDYVSVTHWGYGLFQWHIYRKDDPENMVSFLTRCNTGVVRFFYHAGKLNQDLNCLWHPESCGPKRLFLPVSMLLEAKEKYHDPNP